MSEGTSWSELLAVSYELRAKRICLKIDELIALHFPKT